MQLNKDVISNLIIFLKRSCNKSNMWVTRQDFGIWFSFVAQVLYTVDPMMFQQALY